MKNIIAMVAVLGACATDASQPVSVTAPLKGAEEDMTHNSVLFWNTTGPKCAATVVHTILDDTDPENSFGYVLSDTHCLTLGLQTDGLFFQGDTAVIDDGDISYPEANNYIYDSAAYRNFSLQTVRFSGATEETPVMPMIDPCDDTLAAGDTVTLVSYGEPLEVDGAFMRPVRRSAQATVDAVGALRIYIDDEPEVASCNRDQGGAVLFDAGDGPKLIGVIAGPAECDGNIVANRIAPFIDSGTGLVPFYSDTPDDTAPVCSACYALAAYGPNCQGEASACRANEDCELAWECSQRCTDTACVDACGGGTLFGELTSCARSELSCRDCRVSQCEAGSAPDAGGQTDASLSSDASIAPDGGPGESDAGETTTPDAGGEGTAGGGDDGGCAAMRLSKKPGFGLLALIFAALVLRRRSVF